MDEKAIKLIEKYEDYAKKNGFRLNPNKEIVKGLVEALFMNEKKYGEKYCPCRVITGDKEKDKDKICPCIWHKDEIKKMGHCHCGLFVK